MSDEQMPPLRGQGRQRRSQVESLLQTIRQALATDNAEVGMAAVEQLSRLVETEPMPELTPVPSDIAYPIDAGDSVYVDWGAGYSAWERFRGTVTTVGLNGENPVVVIKHPVALSEENPARARVSTSQPHTPVEG